MAGTERLRPSVEMLTEMLMPAKRRLLLPRMEASALLGAWGQHKAQVGGGGPGRGSCREGVWGPHWRRGGWREPCPPAE